MSMRDNLPDLTSQDDIDMAETRVLPCRDFEGLDLDDGTLSRCWHDEAESFWAMVPWLIVALTGASIFGVLLLISRSITTLEAAINGWW